MGAQIETYHDQDGLAALVIRSDTSLGPGVHFLTDDLLPLQVALMSHPEGKVVTPHVHNQVPREVRTTSEVLVVRAGRLGVTLYREDLSVLAEFELGPGDLILLCGGAHGFKALTPLDMVEIKQGPYLGEADKRRLFLEKP
jgi:mannose-6-phosphate isomerase-like protein (cupin superfamily)